MPSLRKEFEMKIVVFGTRDINIQGGAEKHCKELYSHMKHDTTILPREGNIILDSFVSTVACLLRRIDIVHIHNIGACHFIPLLKLFRKRVVVTIHSLNYQHDKWGRFAKFVLKMGERIAMMADEVIVVSHSIKKQLDYKRKIHVIPNGVGKPVFRKQTWVRYALTVCRITPEKNLRELIKAYKLIKYPNFNIIVVGGGDKIDGLCCVGEKHGKELEELYSNALLYVSTSISEGCPISILEAISYNLPLLVSDIPAHKELHLPTIRYYPLHSIEELARKMKFYIRRGLADVEKIRYKKLLSKYNWEKIAKQTEEVYGHIISRS